MGKKSKKSGLMKDTEAAEILGMSVHTLRQWRISGLGPDFVRMGRNVRYDREAVKKYISSRNNENDSHMRNQNRALNKNDSHMRNQNRALNKNESHMRNQNRALSEYDLLTDVEAASILRLTEEDLAEWRANDQGPDYIYMSGYIRYDANALVEFIQKHTTTINNDLIYCEAEEDYIYVPVISHDGQ